MLDNLIFCQVTKVMNLSVTLNTKVSKLRRHWQKCCRLAFQHIKRQDCGKTYINIIVVYAGQMGLGLSWGGCVGEPDYVYAHVHVSESSSWQKFVGYLLDT